MPGGGEGGLLITYRPFLNLKKNCEVKIFLEFESKLKKVERGRPPPLPDFLGLKFTIPNKFLNSQKLIIAKVGLIYKAIIIKNINKQ